MPSTIPETRLPRARTKGSTPIVLQMPRLQHLQTLRTLLSLIRNPNRGTNRSHKISEGSGQAQAGQLLLRATPRIQLTLIRGPNRRTNRNPKISGRNGRARFGQLLLRATPRIRITSIRSPNRGTNRRPRISTVSKIRSAQDTTSRSLNLDNRKKKRRIRNLQSLRRKTSLRRTTNSLFFRIRFPGGSRAKRHAPRLSYLRLLIRAPK